ncbi:MAG: hypothetical protein RL095_651 [Verrucomicrobiota bacterium]
MPKANFEAAAAGYDRESVLQQDIAAELCRWLKPPVQAGSALDVGCGTGALCEALLGPCPTLSFDLLDDSPAMLALAQARLRRMRPEMQSRLFSKLEELPSGKRYSLIVSSMALQWFDDLPGSLTLLQKRLEPGGALAFALPLEGSLEPFISAFEEAGLPYPGLRYPRPDALLALLPAGSRCQTREWRQEFPDTLAFIRHLHRLGAVRRDTTPMPAVELRRVCTAGDRRRRGGVLRIPWSIGCFQSPG